MSTAAVFCNPLPQWSALQEVNEHHRIFAFPVVVRVEEGESHLLVESDSRLLGIRHQELATNMRGLPAIIEFRITRETPPLLALRGREKSRSMSGLWDGGGGRLTTDHVPTGLPSL
ncbi:MAG: hypothetical protein Q8O37_10740 [Sulfuricellaceae bacterium]|nr:hypothetical protein [Sulfuricellaceae bacterium]